jgi:hypothetical protein
VFELTGPGAAAEAEALKAAPGVQSVAALAPACTWPGRTRPRWQRASPAGPAPRRAVAPAQANLEDVFIGLIGQARTTWRRAR